MQEPGCPFLQTGTRRAWGLACRRQGGHGNRPLQRSSPSQSCRPGLEGEDRGDRLQSWQPRAQARLLDLGRHRRQGPTLCLHRGR